MTIYKILPRALWLDALAQGRLDGAPVDLADGFIHFSAGHQVEATAARHFSGQDDLVLAAFDEATLGPALKWEPSRGGDLFPHLYAPLPTGAALWVRPLPRTETGHDFSELLE